MTSTYVLGEFVTGLLHNAVALIDIVMEAALKSARRLEKSQQRMLARIEKVLDFGMIRARGFISCRALSDAVIATEMPRTATLMTTNKRHFEILCSALEKKLFN